MNPKVTIITGLWDLKRGDIEGWGKRDFQTYKDKFFELLKSPVQMAIFIPESMREEVEKVRQKFPTKIYIKELEKFKVRTFDLDGGDLLYNCRMWIDDLPFSKHEMMVLESDNKFYIIGFQ